MAKLSKKQQELNQKLENACVVGNLDEVKELINQGANLKVEGRAENPFFYAAANGHLEVVKYFIENGVRINTKYNFGTTAICRAVGGGHYEVVDYLIDNGAKLDLTFEYAAASNRLEMVKHLHQKGADIRKSPAAIVDASRYGYIDIIKYLISIGADIQHNENEAITIASRDGFLEVVKCLHQNGADIHFKNDLMFVNASERGYLETVKYYVENGADVHTNNGYAIIGAARNGELDVVKYLHQQGADIYTDNNQAIKWASSNGYLEVVKYLVENGADVHGNNNEAIVRASKYEHLEVVKYLHQKGADLDKAIENANPKIKEELISYKEKSLFEDDLKDMVFAKKKTDPLRV